jgi:malate synthase
VKNEVGNDNFNNGNFTLARAILEDITLSENLEDFLTLKAYGDL